MYILRLAAHVVMTSSASGMRFQTVQMHQIPTLNYHVKLLTPEKPAYMVSQAHRMSYRIGRGEQGVLTFDPYKSDILPLWRFKTPTIARQSADQIYEKFLEYEKQDDFVGMDMCRKFLQMARISRSA